MLADEAGLDLAADEQHRRGRAVVGALAAVLLGAAAELRERHHQDAVAVAARRQVLEERGHRAGDLRQQVGVGRRLGGVRVEAVDGDVEDAGAEVGVDELGGQLEAVGQRRVADTSPWADSSCRSPASGGCWRRCWPRSSARSRAGRRPTFGLAAPSITSRWFFLSAPLAAAVCNWNSSSVVIDGTRAGAPSRASGDVSLLVLRWNDGDRRHVLERLADPAFGERVGRRGRLPDVHRAEVRLGRVGIADALHDAQGVVLQQFGQAVHAGMQADLVVDLLDLRAGDGERRPGLGVVGVVEGMTVLRPSLPPVSWTTTRMVSLPPGLSDAGARAAARLRKAGTFRPQAARPAGASASGSRDDSETWDAPWSVGQVCNLPVPTAGYKPALQH